MTAETEPVVVEPSHEVRKVRDWRKEMLVELGFTADDAAYLAAVRDLDWHEAERLVRLGCPSELVLEILM